MICAAVVCAAADRTGGVGFAPTRTILTEAWLAAARADAAHLVDLCGYLKEVVELIFDDRLAGDADAGIERLTAQANGVLEQLSSRCNLQVFDVRHALSKLTTATRSEREHCADALLWFFQRPGRSIKLHRNNVRFFAYVGDVPLQRPTSDGVMDVVQYDNCYWSLWKGKEDVDESLDIYQALVWPLSRHVLIHVESSDSKDVLSLFVERVSDEVHQRHQQIAETLPKQAALSRNRSRSRAPNRNVQQSSSISTTLASVKREVVEPLVDTLRHNATTPGEMGSSCNKGRTSLVNGGKVASSSRPGKRSREVGAHQSTSVDTSVPAEYLAVIKASDAVSAVNTNTKGGAEAFRDAVSSLDTAASFLADPLKHDVVQLLSTLRNTHQPKMPSIMRALCANIRNLLIERGQPVKVKREIEDAMPFLTAATRSP